MANLSCGDCNSCGSATIAQLLQRIVELIDRMDPTSAFPLLIDCARMIQLPSGQGPGVKMGAEGIWDVLCVACILQPVLYSFLAENFLLFDRLHNGSKL